MVGYWGFVLVVDFLCLGYCGRGYGGMRLLWLSGYYDIFSIGVFIFSVGS